MILTTPQRKINTRQKTEGPPKRDKVGALEIVTPYTVWTGIDGKMDQKDLISKSKPPNNSKKVIKPTKRPRRPDYPENPTHESSQSLGNPKYERGQKLLKNFPCTVNPRRWQGPAGYSHRSPRFARRTWWTPNLEISTWTKNTVSNRKRQNIHLKSNINILKQRFLQNSL